MIDERKPRVWVVPYSDAPDGNLRIEVPSEDTYGWSDGVAVHCASSFSFFEVGDVERVTVESDPSLDAATVRVHPRRDR